MANNGNSSQGQDHQFPVVGIGASAGGVKALQDFFTHLPDDTGMAFAVIVHLSPDHPSTMDQLLEKCTNMKVRQVTEKTELTPNYVYIIAPDQQLTISGNYILTQHEEEQVGHTTIDTFLQSLAEERAKLAVGVILSGTGTDGTIGLKAIKEKGGIGMTQDPGEAEHAGMPQSVIDSGLADFILPVKELGPKVAEHKELLSEVQVPLQEKELSEKETQALEEIFGLVSSKTHRDFTHYKRTTVLRRLERRIYVTGASGIPAYRDYLKENDQEVIELYKDLLISVTSFFRDPQSFEVLEEEVIPQLFDGKGPGDQVRVWSAGCATGEEAYSLAILLYEYASTLTNPPEVKIFATDIDEEALETARKGIYPESIQPVISKERLKQFFKHQKHSYIVRDEIREMVVFAVHDVLANPPMSNQDLISCRNLLIYFNKRLQEEVLHLLYYALRPEGYLHLGLSGSVHQAQNLYSQIDKKLGIYKKRHTSKLQKRLPHTPLWKNISHSTKSYKKEKDGHAGRNISDSHYQLLARQFAPPSVIIDESYEVFHAAEGMGQFLTYVEGTPSRDILDMIIPELNSSLRSMLFEFQQSDQPSLLKKITYHQDGQEQTIRLLVQPVQLADFAEEYIQVTFEPLKGALSEDSKDGSSSRDVPVEDQEVIEQLQRELEVNKEHLRVLQEEYETSNEELRTSNEELLSMNEELQFTTEALKKNKEELQSLNKDLKAVNEELKGKNQQQLEINNDLKNLMEATEVGIIFVDRELKVKRYTSRVTDLFNMIPADLGRPISHITHKLEYDNLREDARQVLDDLQTQKHIVSASNNQWYIMRLRPYQTIEDKIGGVVITFVDITQLKQTTEELEERASHQQALADLGLFALNEHDLQSTLNETIRLINEQLDSDYIGLFELKKEDSLSISAGKGWPEDKTKKAQITADRQNVFGYTLSAPKPVVVSNFTEEKRFSRPPLLADLDVTSGIIIVVKGKSGQPYGLLGIFTSGERSFNKNYVHFLQVIANLLGEFFKRIQAEEELQQVNSDFEERTKELEKVNIQLEDKIKERDRLQEEILEVSENERWQTAQFLHDELGQPMVAIEIQIQTLLLSLQKEENLDHVIEDLQQIIQMVKQVSENIRELSNDVIPIDVEEGDLEHAFEDIADEAEKFYSLKCTFKMDISEELIKNTFVATHLHRIAQEAVKNAGEHSKASEVVVTLTRNEKDLILLVEDDGIGYESRRKSDGAGLKLMKYRAEHMDGMLDIHKIHDNKGTRVSCSVPLERAQKKESFKNNRVKI